MVQALYSETTLKQSNKKDAIASVIGVAVVVSPHSFLHASFPPNSNTRKIKHFIGDLITS
jgi:hypothetical protein